MIEYAKCPKCGEELIASLTSDVEYRGDRLEVYFSGNCPNHCYNRYTWIELYEYAGFKNVKGEE